MTSPLAPLLIQERGGIALRFRGEVGRGARGEVEVFLIKNPIKLDCLNAMIRACMKKELG